ncbi:MAG: molybdopterin biosynthesis protein MoeE [Deltaproteobacteria bacterium RIFCSPLOWO2_12_FULL_43_16]|nr:MAG: molybdopterin biosynthesis protein MoeE [Deltaproteobacteria bacterium GWA2_43_19]OGQ10082.1 MAG: molybdopterin biosynthesis protein MoeE [Deltaproteobacteria bacterium RIFCSPHIGHO2_02_FULL_43_33]OGQ40162.1 MAG: molybdopterin biosynthesis protein MoeE [Deltaproteobacteria bacterium RIFCSPLOWO2_01_FULL_42_9]OGQ59065.1 MAG: molybdopterin biosynthesis protein MoeE [Deltaproteobacteria bacterium RIFCSPLOWO2_12_FULL_43_16]HBR18450.1 molybdopterin biosynthesis protein MoeE [Deltaproteobacteri
MDLVRIQKQDFDINKEVELVKAASKSIGGVVSFLGAGRDISKGEQITMLDFEHYPGMAEKKLQEIRERALKNFNIIEMGIVHRIGEIDIGENIVLIIAAAQHRNDAFMACEWAIAELKRITPIWKRETTKKGEVWVEEHP